MAAIVSQPGELTSAWYTSGSEIPQATQFLRCPCAAIMFCKSEINVLLHHPGKKTTIYVAVASLDLLSLHHPEFRQN